MKKLFLYLISTVFAVSSTENLLFEALKETSTIATRTKLNIDDMPSTIAVIQSDELARSGALTLHDALGQIAGVQASKSYNGWSMVTIRGVANPKSFGFDKVKLIVDGVDVTSHLYETLYYYLDLSVELIERIEILRGPASSVYGAGAFAGAISVVTKLSELKNTSFGFIRAGNYSYRSAGALGVWSVGDWKIGVDAYKQADQASVDYPTPRNGYGGKSHHGFDDESVGVRIKNGNFVAHGRIKRAVYENQVGENVTPAINDDRDNKNQFAFVELKYESAPYKELELSMRAGVREYTFDNKISALTIDQVREKLKSTVNDPSADKFIDANTTNYGIVDFYSKERSVYGEIVANLDAGRHKPTIGLYIENSQNLDNFVASNYLTDEIMADLASGNPQNDWGKARKIGSDQGFLGDGDFDRTVTALWIQDIISITDNLDLTIGARGDHCSDMDKTFPSYRVGGVYRATNSDRIKLMLGHAFRAPSLVELYSKGARDLIPVGNEELDAETIDTLEFSWRRKLQNGSFGATVFHSVLKDPIDADASRDKFYNYPDRTTTGIEIEYAQRIAEHHFVGANLTYMEATAKGDQPFSDEKNPKMADIATQMGNLFHTWYLPRNIQLSTHISHIGSMTQNKTGDKVPDHTVVNESILYKINSQTSMKLTINNLFDTQTKIPSLYGYHEKGTPQVGRRAYFGLMHRF